MTRPTDAEVREMIERLRAAFSKAINGPSRARGGAGGMTIEEYMRGTFRQISEWDLELMAQAADMLEALTAQETQNDRT